MLETVFCKDESQKPSPILNIYCYNSKYIHLGSTFESHLYKRQSLTREHLINFSMFGNLEFISKYWIGPNIMFDKSWIWKCWNWVNSMEFQQQCKIDEISKFANSIYVGVIYNSWIWIPNLNSSFSNEFYIRKHHLRHFDIFISSSFV